MSMLCVRASMSANTGVAPTSRITFAVATQELGVVITSHPGPMSARRRPISMVHVPELNVRTGRPEKNSDSSDSSAWTFGPLLVSHPERRTSDTAATVASSMVGLVKGRKSGTLAVDVIPEFYPRSTRLDTRHPHQRLPHANPSPALDALAQRRPVRREHDNGRAVLEPPH